MENISIQVSVHDDLTVISFEGSLNAKEVFEYAAKCYKSVPTTYILVDARFCTINLISSDDLREIAKNMVDLTVRPKGGKTAFVLNRKEAYQKGQLHKIFAILENLPINYGIFPIIEDAKIWLFKSGN